MDMHMKHFEITKFDILAGKNDAMSLIEPLWYSVSIYDGLEQYEHDLAPFTDAQRYILAVKWYEAEVCNGGHDQFLYNSTGIVWQDALCGFEMIGADRCAEILRNVIRKCGGVIPFDREAREDMLDQLDADDDDDIFGADDTAFYDAEDTLESLILAYVTAHPDEFVFSGDVPVPKEAL